MIQRQIVAYCLIAGALLLSTALRAQEKKLDRIRVGGGSASATQMSLWLAKEGGYYEKHGLNVEVISIPGSSLAIQAMLSGELPIIQAGGAGPVQAALSGTDTVIIATIAKKFNWWIYAQPSFARMEDLKGKVFGVTRFGTQSDLASRMALRRSGLEPGGRRDRKLGRHDHAICNKCGKLVDLDLPVDAAMIKQASKLSKFKAESIEMILRGLCPECSAPA